MTESTNPILAQPLEVRLWLEAKMKEDLTSKEILELFLTQFPWVKGVKVSHVTSYRKKYLPHYKELILQRYGKEREKPPEEIEEEILQEVRDAEVADDEFTKDEKRKTNMIKAQKTLLKEMYENYRAIKSSTDETTKKNYLVEMAKQLIVIGDLEASEKSFLSSMNEIRLAELRLTVDQYLDSICGWFLLRMFDRAGSKEKALEAIRILHLFLEDYKSTLEGAKDIVDANKKTLEKLYVSKKIKEEDEK